MTSPHSALLGLAVEPDPHAVSQSLEEPGWLLEDRLDGIRRAADLPLETNSLWTPYVDLRLARFGDVTPYATSGEAAEVATHRPRGASATIHVREDTLVERGIDPDAERAGVIVDTFANVMRRDPDLLRRLIEEGAGLPANDRLAQLTRAWFGLGVVVYVPDGVHLEQPIALRWSMGEPGSGCLTRTIVALGRDAHASMLEEQDASAAPDGRQSLWTGTTEVLLGEGATLDVAAQEDFGPDTVAFVHRRARLGTSASLRWALATVGGRLVKHRIDNDLEGRGASVRQVEIAFGGADQLFDMSSYTRHLGEDTTGDLLSKGVFKDRSRGFFKGLIEIKQHARGTDSFLGEFGMLLSKKARSVTIPSLEIDQPDVRRAAHSSSVGPIDESQVFYLMSRGVPEDVARKFVVLGFLEPVVARIPLPEAQQRLRGLLDRKWSTSASDQAGGGHPAGRRTEPGVPAAAGA